jgi:hypothetical protein
VRCDRSVVMTKGEVLRSSWSFCSAVRSSLFSGITRPDAPLLASSLRCSAAPKLPSASVTMSHVSEGARHVEGRSGSVAACRAAGGKQDLSPSLTSRSGGEKLSEREASAPVMRTLDFGRRTAIRKYRGVERLGNTRIDDAWEDDDLTSCHFGPRLM